MNKKYDIEKNIKEYTLKLRDLDNKDKPREKMLKSGIEFLSSRELLSIILNTGTKKEDVSSMSRRILEEYGDNNATKFTDPEKFSKVFDIPIIKSCQIIASFELGKRLFSKKSKKDKYIRNAKQAYEYLKNIGSFDKEYLKAIYLNSRYKLIHEEIISIGSSTANIIDPKEIFKPALEYGAIALIIAHNHPSGKTIPSKEDIEITKKIVNAGKMLGIEVLDHLIITDTKFSSIK